MTDNELANYNKLIKLGLFESAWVIQSDVFEHNRDFNAFVAYYQRMNRIYTV